VNKHHGKLCKRSLAPDIHRGFSRWRTIRIRNKSLQKQPDRCNILHRNKHHETSTIMATLPFQLNLLRPAIQRLWSNRLSHSQLPNPGRHTRKTVPLMTNASISDNSRFWQIEPWGDGSFFLSNAANGTEWHLEKKPNSLMAMSSNITAPQDGQRFSFKQLGQIQNGEFTTVAVCIPLFMYGLCADSMIQTPSETSTAIPSGSITNSPAPSSNSSSPGLSTGAKAGIGAGVGVAAFVALLILGFFLLKRRKRTARPSGQEPTPPYEAVSQHPYETEGKQLNDGGPGELDAPVAHPAELTSDNTQRPAELPAWNGRP